MLSPSRKDIDFSEIPIIDISPLKEDSAARRTVAAEIGRACRECGFFYIVGHGVPKELQTALATVAQRFFAQDLNDKLTIPMSRGGRAWRGYFPVGDELTSGQPDRKEGLYFGSELAATHPLVLAETPLFGPNLFPAFLPELREAVLDYMAALTQLGHLLMEGIAESLELPRTYFAERYTADPLTLFRIFHYPASGETSHEARSWGVGEHTDYGVLTILLQDDVGGLEVKSRSRWIAAPPVADSFVCNIGDMLDRMTGGRYRSTAHRVQNLSGRSRYSFPFFFDPNFHKEIRPIEHLPAAPTNDDQHERWDGRSVHTWQGTYGDYLLGKIGKVFPELRRSVL